MPYEIRVAPAARRQLARLPRPAQARVAAAIESLGEEPRRHAEKLAGAPGLWRSRVGEYRIVYQVHDEILLVLVVKVGHRRDVYRRRRGG